MFATRWGVAADLASAAFLDPDPRPIPGKRIDIGHFATQFRAVIQDRAGAGQESADRPLCCPVVLDVALVGSGHKGD